MRVELSDAASTTELRRAVLRPTWPVGSVLPGDDESTALHFAAWEGDEIVGAALVLPAAYSKRPNVTDGVWQLRGMATAETARGTGVGRALIAAVVDDIVARGARLLWCNARTTALGFYERNGFTVDGPEFVYEPSGLPHHVMSRPLGR